MKSLQVLLIAAVLIIQAYSQNYRRQPIHQSVFVRDTPQVPINSGACPEKNGRFPTSTCDGYIECKDGVAEEKVCPDGLLFNAAADIFAFPCQYPIDVDCTGREQTHPAQPTDDCPHQFGYYRMGDEANCGKFINCVDGHAHVFDCPEGLAFNGETYRCDWPDQVPTCNAEAYLGFSCPPDAKSLGLGLGDEEFRYFRSPHDCQHYYICIQGKPRIYNCRENQAFNDITNSCDSIENVTGCAIPTNNYNEEFNSKRKPVYNTNFRVSG